jgi:hypothetical protein
VECTDWINAGLDSASARFLMVTAITHHRFSSAVWDEYEVRKLHAELAEIDALAALAVADRDTGRSARRRPGNR